MGKRIRTVRMRRITGLHARPHLDYDKVCGAHQLKEIEKALPADKRQHVSFCHPAEILCPVASQENIETIVRNLSKKHPNVARFFLRGNTAQAVKENRQAAYRQNPRGHYFPKEDRFKWDANVWRAADGEPGHHAPTVEWLIYKTRSDSEVHYRGRVFFNYLGNNRIKVGVIYGPDGDPKFCGHFEVDLKKINDIEGTRFFKLQAGNPLQNGPVNTVALKAVARAFIDVYRARLKQLGKDRTQTLEFITWKHEKHKPEFYNAITGK